MSFMLHILKRIQCGQRPQGGNQSDKHGTESVYMKTDAQVISFYRAVQHGKAIVIDATPETLAALSENDADIVKRINLLFDMMAEAQEKAFGPIVNKVLKKD